VVLGHMGAGGKKVRWYGRQGKIWERGEKKIQSRDVRAGKARDKILSQSGGSLRLGASENASGGVGKP